ncbi:MAG: outer membrane beta-barrel protein [Candidatus Krumholzibacteriia bacterium]
MKTFMGLLVILCALFPTPANALLLGPAITVGAGSSFPVGPDSFKDEWNGGLAVTGALKLKLVPLLSLGIEVGYYRHEHDNDAFASTFPNVSIGGRDLWVIPVSAVGELTLLGRGSTKPYLRVGVGIYKIGTSDFSASGAGAADLIRDVQANDPSETAVGTLVGLGVRTPIALGIHLFIDATYHVINSEDGATQFLPVRAGIQF